MAKNKKGGRRITAPPPSITLARFDEYFDDPECNPKIFGKPTIMLDDSRLEDSRREEIESLRFSHNLESRLLKAGCWGVDR